MKEDKKISVQVVTNNGKIKAVVKENADNPVQAALDKLSEERGVEQIRAQMTVGEKKLASIPLSLLNIDERYQRTENFSLSRAEKIARNFKEDYCGVITVFYRNGKFWVSDGMHRVMARILRGDEEIVASIISGDSVEDGYVHEVMTFVEQATNTRRPSAYDRLKALASIDQSPAKEIMEICNKYKISIVPRTTKAVNGTISCVSLILNLVRVHGTTHLDEVLGFLCGCGWNEQDMGLTRYYVSLASFVIRLLKDENKSTKEMILLTLEERLRKITPKQYQAEAIVKHLNFQVETAMFRHMRELIDEIKEEVLS